MQKSSKNLKSRNPKVFQVKHKTKAADKEEV